MSFDDDLGTALDKIMSAAASSGWFEAVNGAEPKSAPSVRGLTAAVWADRMAAVAKTSGLAVTSAMVVFNVRVYSSMLQEPADAIDPNIIKAAGALIAAYAADFDLGVTGAEVDLLGAHGPALGGAAGYLEIDKKMFRVMTLSVPVKFFDAWTQAR
jgi:hypothetical protein